MPGIFGSLSFAQNEISDGSEMYEINHSENLVNGFMKSDSLYVERHLNKKFLNDKVFLENENYAAAIDGVIINMNFLVAEYLVESFFECITKMYEKNGDFFFKEFRGNFCGVFSDKKSGKHIVFNNVIGTKTVYYSQINGRLIFASDINYIVGYFRQNNIKYTFDEKTAWVMVKYPHLPDDYTFFKEIRRLVHSHCIITDNNSFNIIKYHEFDLAPDKNYNEEETIEKIDNIFRNLVDESFKKDTEYGYKHIVTLSSGLDSKVITWIAHELGYSDHIWNITYSQPDFWDEIVPKKMAADLCHKWTFHSLANGLLTMNIDECVRLNGGGYYFAGIAQGLNAFKALNIEEYGMLQAGLASDLLSPLVQGCSKVFNLRGLYYNNRLDHVFTKEDEVFLKERYKNNEMFRFQLVANNSENTQQIGLGYYTEVYSPFFDVELSQVFLSVPVESRYNRHLYIKWLVSKYPKMSEYVYDKADIPLTVFFNEGRTAWNINPSSKVGYMNPFDYWYESSAKYRSVLDEYFKDNIERLPEHNEMRQRATVMYNRGKTYDKLRIVTILSVLKNYFG